MSKNPKEREFVALNIAVLTVSDTRTQEDDRSGDTLVRRLEEAGHVLAARDIVVDDRETISSKLRDWVEDGRKRLVDRDILERLALKWQQSGASRFSGPTSRP